MRSYTHLQKENPFNRQLVSRGSPQSSLAWLGALSTSIGNRIWTDDRLRQRNDRDYDQRILDIYQWGSGDECDESV